MKILIEKLTFDCIIGILDFERTNSQKVVIDICFDYNFIDKTDFIDYSKIVKEVETIMKKQKFELLEEAIIYLEQFLNNKYKIKNLNIKITKPTILTNCIVSLQK